MFGNDTKKLYAGVFHCRLNLAEACWLLVKTFLSARWLSQSMMIKLYRTISFPVVLCGCETWCLTLEEHRLRVFENRVRGEWKKILMGVFSWLVLITKYYSGYQIKEDGMGGAYCTHLGEGNFAGLWMGNLKEGLHLEDLGVERRIILNFGVVWICLADCCDHGNEPSGVTWSV